MKRPISKIELLFTSISAIIGSGWLFSAFYTARIAGPAATLSWIIGGAIVVCIAFVFAEICAMLPISGSSVRIPQFTHGSLVSFIFAWIIWLSYAGLASIEIQGVVQYLSFYFPSLVINNSDRLSHFGYVIATFLLIIASALNVYSIRWLIRSNNFLTVLKILIPLFVAIVILIYFFTPQSILHPAASSFMPFGYSGVLSAISAGGIIFAFNGFKQAAEMAGEAENPGKALPLALIGSVLFCLVIYLFVQFAFNASLDASNIASGWDKLTLGNNSSPLAAIITHDNFNWLLPVIYIGAMIAPFAACLMYCGSAGRSLAGMSRNGYLPGFIQLISRRGNPTYAIIINFAISLFFFIPLHGWGTRMAFITLLLTLSYAIGPVTLLALRYQAPKQKRPLKLPCAHLWAIGAFYLCTSRAYYAGWDIVSNLGFVIVAALLFLSVENFLLKKKDKIHLNWRESIWVWPYFIGLITISYLGDGKKIISEQTALIAIGTLCVITMFLAIRFRLPNKVTQNYIEELHLEHNNETF